MTLKDKIELEREFAEARYQEAATNRDPLIAEQDALFAMLKEELAKPRHYVPERKPREYAADAREIVESALARVWNDVVHYVPEPELAKYSNEIVKAVAKALKAAEKTGSQPKIDPKRSRDDRKVLAISDRLTKVVALRYKSAMLAEDDSVLLEALRTRVMPLSAWACWQLARDINR